MSFEVGAEIRQREVWDGAAWLEHPVRVVGDEGVSGVLAVATERGCPLSYPAHPRGPHPWSGQDRWQGNATLHLRRSADWYSVWMFFTDVGVFDCWYVNFERPVIRTAVGIDTDDLELDLVVDPDGARHWKDVERLAQRLDERRFGTDELVAVLRAAAEVCDLLDRDDRWWAPWDTWTPADLPRSGPVEG